MVFPVAGWCIVCKGSIVVPSVPKLKENPTLSNMVDVCPVVNVAEALLFKDRV